MPTEFRNIAQGELFGIPVEVIVAITVALIYIVILELSVWGRQIHAMGMQRSASIVAGIRTNRNLVLAFVIASSTCAIAGLIAAANIRMFTPLSGFAYLLDAIAATFIGAALHPRGRPNVPGTIVGVSVSWHGRERIEFNGSKLQYQGCFVRHYTSVGIGLGRCSAQDEIIGVAGFII